MQNQGSAQNDAGDTTGQNDDAGAALQMAFPPVAQNSADAQKNTGDLVCGQRRGEAEPEENQDRKLDQAHAAAGDGREEIGNDGGHEKDELTGEIESHGNTGGAMGK